MIERAVPIPAERESLHVAPSSDLELVYVLGRFPTISETFVLREIQEVKRQGDRVFICSLHRPVPGEPVHAGAAELATEACYVPADRWRVGAFAVALLSTLARNPVRCLRALWCALRWSIQDRRPVHLRRLGEAAFLSGRIPASTQHIHGHFATGPAAVAFLLSVLTDRPFSFTAHAFDIFTPPSRSTIREIGRAASFVAVETEFTQRVMRDLLDSADHSKVIVVHNGIDLSRFRPQTGPPAGKPRLLSVCRLVEKKGVDVLLRACALLVQRGLEFRYEIVGDGPLRPRLEDLVRDLELGDVVVFRGAMGNEEVRNALDGAAVFALACRRTSKGDQDGLPVSILEALAAGVPVVSTPISGIPEAVQNSSSGLLVPPDDPEALAAAIEGILRDAELAGRLTAGGREVVKGFELGRTVRGLRRLFADAAAAT
jgi:glycosyltransferase involved in cell wall biosynthesis